MSFPRHAGVELGCMPIGLLLDRLSRVTRELNQVSIDQVRDGPSLSRVTRELNYHLLVCLKADLVFPASRGS